MFTLNTSSAVGGDIVHGKGSSTRQNSTPTRGRLNSDKGRFNSDKTRFSPDNAIFPRQRRKMLNSYELPRVSRYV